MDVTPIGLRSPIQGKIRRLTWDLVRASSIVLSLFAATAHARDEVTLFETVYVGGFVCAGVVAFALIMWLRRKNRNPWTGLPRPVKRRRVRGRLPKYRP